MKEFNDRFYPETLNWEQPVMKNKLGIKNINELEENELSYSIIRLYQISNKTVPGNFDLKHLQAYHKYIFGDVYEWAGDIRQFEIMKYEEVLQGASVNYEEPLMIVPLIRDTLNKFNSTDFFNKSIDEKTSAFCETLAKVWKAHPFNEGNTRSITKFMCDAAANKGIEIESRLFTEHHDFFRRALVVYQFGKKNYLQDIVKDAIQKGNSQMIGNNDLGIVINSFVKDKLDKESINKKFFVFQNEYYQILDISKNQGKAQADALILKCNTNDIYFERNLAGTCPLKLDLKKNMDKDSHKKQLSTSSQMQ